MKKHIKNTIVCTIFTLLICIAAFCVVMRNNEPNTCKQKTYKRYSSNKLIHEFNNQSSKNLIEKTIEVKGTLKKIHTKNSKHTLYLSDDNNKTYILCELQGNQSHKLSHLKLGHPVKIKGVFKGHLVDLILLNCIIK